MAKKFQRIAIVRDENGAWFVRQIAYNNQDNTKGEMIYHCNMHISGPHDRLEDVPQVRGAIDAAIANVADGRPI